MRRSTANFLRCVNEHTTPLNRSCFTDTGIITVFMFLKHEYILQKLIHIWVSRLFLASDTGFPHSRRHHRCCDGRGRFRMIVRYHYIDNLMTDTNCGGCYEQQCTDRMTWRLSYKCRHCSMAKLAMQHCKQRLSGDVGARGGPSVALEPVISWRALQKKGMKKESMRRRRRRW
jgi:hypothetical protein